MDERLPRISIRTDAPALEFLRRLHQIALQTECFAVTLDENLTGEEAFHVLTLEPMESAPHTSLWVQLSRNPWMVEPNLVTVELRAGEWSPQPPTYDVYSQAARRILDPLLRQYNKEHKSKRRLVIQPRSATAPNLPPVAQEIFDTFVKLANKTSLHPFDWDRFYAFIYHCARRNIDIDQGDVKWLLVTAGFAEVHASHVCDIFQHGVDLLDATYRGFVPGGTFARPEGRPLSVHERMILKLACSDKLPPVGITGENLGSAGLGVRYQAVAANVGISMNEVEQTMMRLQAKGAIVQAAVPSNWGRRIMNQKRNMANPTIWTAKRAEKA